MYRIVYPVLFALSYTGTRLWGVEPTVRTFKRVGRILQTLRLSKPRSPEELKDRIVSSFQMLPLSIRCLDQAIVTWHLLNLHGHEAEMKIGVTLSPVMSHAWVVQGGNVFVNSVYIPDMQEVAAYPAWCVTVPASS